MTTPFVGRWAFDFSPSTEGAPDPPPRIRRNGASGRGRGCRPAEDVGAEGLQPGRAGVAEVRQPEEVLPRTQQRVVVVRRVVDRPRDREGRDDDGAGATAARADD